MHLWYEAARKVWFINAQFTPQSSDGAFSKMPWMKTNTVISQTDCVAWINAPEIALPIGKRAWQCWLGYGPVETAQWQERLAVVAVRDIMQQVPEPESEPTTAADALVA